MATAQRTTKTKTVTKEVPTIRLDLSINEAQFFRKVLQRVGGNPFHSARIYADSINRALGEAGIPYGCGDRYQVTDTAIAFRDQPNLIACEKAADAA